MLAYSSLVEIRSPRVRKGTLVILWFGRAGGRACARVPLRSCDLMFGFDFVWIMDHGSSIKDQVSWTLDLGPGMNGHPGRDTDLRSRPSESTIKDLSFFIGFIKIQSSNKHVGPCFVMNGHFCRDPDLISRLPGTTTQALSVFIGFRCSSTFKIGV